MPPQPNPPPRAQATTGLFATWQQRLQPVIDLVFPPRCANCGCADTVWCARCTVQLAAVPLLLSTPARPPQPLSALATTGQHTGILKTAVHALKYDALPVMAKPLSRRLAATLSALRASHGALWSPQIIVPVPLHPKRQALRGYNQAHLLAAMLAKRQQLPYAPRAWTRNRHTPQQVGLNRDERLQNMLNAFTSPSREIYGKIVLIVDDVATTGATLSACGDALLQAGAASVVALTVTAARITESV